MEIEPNFPPAPVVRTQRTRRQFNYEARDEPSVDPLSKFRTEFFYYILDTALNSVSERFE